MYRLQPTGSDMHAEKVQGLPQPVMMRGLLTGACMGTLAASTRKGKEVSYNYKYACHVPGTRGGRAVCGSGQGATWS